MPAKNESKNVYQTIAWLYEFDGTMSAKVYETKTLTLEKGGKIRIKTLSEETREKIAAKNGKDVDAQAVATLEYASPEALAEFAASRQVAKPVAAKKAVAASRF